MRFILVDAWDERVKEVEVKKLDLETIHNLLRCDMIEAHSLPGVPSTTSIATRWANCGNPCLRPLSWNGFWDVLRGSLLIFKAKGDEEASATCSKGMAQHIVTFLGDEH